VQDGKHLSWYRNDGHCKGCQNREHFVEGTWFWQKPSHCEKCKRPEHRVWREPKAREIPPDTVDMLSAVYLARSLLREGRESEEILLLDRQRLWRVRLRAGVRRVVETPAGRFECREVRLETTLPPGEEPTDSGFEGMFGLQGTIGVWLDARYGVPVQITGDFPASFLGSLDVLVQLKSYRGTPLGFRALDD
jgi:hypothetical protein